MSDFERGSGGGKPEFKLILPTLPTLYDGVFEDVYADYLNNPDEFMVALNYRVSIDNPELESAFKDDLFISQESIKWAALYYEMFARSSRKVGLPMMGISGDKLNASSRLEMLKIQRGFESLEAQEEVFQAQKDGFRRRRDRDESLSPELVKFWNMVDQHSNGILEDGGSEVEVMFELIPLYVIQEILQRQNDEYSLVSQEISGLL